MAAVIEASHVVVARVSLWNGGALMHEALPVVTGSVSSNLADKVPGRVTLTIADDGRSRALMDCAGQRLHVERGWVDPRTGQPVLVGLGWFQVASYEVTRDGIQVEALGLMTVLEQAVMTGVWPVGSPDMPTYLSSIHYVVDVLGIPMTANVADRAAAPTNYEGDRVDALLKVCESWPARMGFDDNGVLTFDGLLSDADPVTFHFDSGVNGTRISLAENASRDGVKNWVKVTSTDADGAPLWAEIKDENPDSPTYVGGPYGVVSEIVDNRSLVTQAEVDQAAWNRLVTSMKRRTTYRIEALPNPYVRTGHVALLDGTTKVRITEFTIPLTAAGGSMTMTGVTL